MSKRKMGGTPTGIDRQEAEAMQRGMKDTWWEWWGSIGSDCEW